jgi:hypothetical protein
MSSKDAADSYPPRNHQPVEKKHYICYLNLKWLSEIQVQKLYRFLRCIIYYLKFN